jgi:hypothetical protein
VVTSKLDRGYDDLTSGRISDEFWTRKSKEWELELATSHQELGRVQRPDRAACVSASKILELAKQAETLFKSQNPAEQRRLLETVLSNCTFDCGSLSPSYASPFDLLVKRNETGDWRRGWDSSQVATSRSSSPDALEATRTDMTERERRSGGPSGMNFATGCTRLGNATRFGTCPWRQSSEQSAPG